MALIVTPRFLPLLGGMERECALLADELARRGLRPLIVTEQLGTDLPRHEWDGAVEVVRLPSSEQRTLGVQVAVALRLMAVIVRRHREIAFGIVRTMTLPSLAVGLLKRLRLARFPTLVTAETGGAADDVQALAARPLFPLARALASGHDRLNGLCQANVDHFREFGFPERKLSMVPNGIDVSAWECAVPPERVEHLLFLGRVEPAKGVFELIEALAAIRVRHPGVHLTVAGDGPSTEDLRTQASAAGLGEAVAFVGRVDYENVPALLASVDALVLPSYSEGMPLSVLEAAAQRRALIVTDVGDIRRLFGDHVYLCVPRDAKDLERALEEAVTDPNPRTGYDDVVADVSIASVADRLLSELGLPALPAA